MFEIPLRTLWAWEAGVNSPHLLTQRVVIAVLESLRAERLTVKVRITPRRRSCKQSSLVDATVSQGGKLD
jgi:hypothetical protein